MFNSVYIQNSLEVHIYNYCICDLIYSQVSYLKRFAYSHFLYVYLFTITYGLTKRLPTHVSVVVRLNKLLLTMLLNNSVLSLFLHRSTSTDVHPASECSQGHWNVGCLQYHGSRRDGSGKPTLCIWQCYALYVCTHVYTVLVT